MSEPQGARRITILAFAGVQSLDVTGPLEVFAAARELIAARGAGARLRAARGQR